MLPASRLRPGKPMCHEGAQYLPPIPPKTPTPLDNKARLRLGLSPCPPEGALDLSGYAFFMNPARCGLAKGVSTKDMAYFSSPQRT